MAPLLLRTGLRLLLLLLLLLPPHPVVDVVARDAPVVRVAVVACPARVAAVVRREADASSAKGFFKLEKTE